MVDDIDNKFRRFGFEDWRLMIMVLIMTTMTMIKTIASLSKVPHCSDETMMHVGNQFPSELQPHPDKRREGRVG